MPHRLQEFLLNRKLKGNNYNVFASSSTQQKKKKVLQSKAKREEQKQHPVLATESKKVYENFGFLFETEGHFGKVEATESSSLFSKCPKTLPVSIQVSKQY